MQLPIHITQPILDENQWNKLQCDLHSKIYQKHSTISRIRQVEISPCWKCRNELGCFKAWQCKIEILQSLYEWMEQGFDVNCARSCSIPHLPLMKLTLTVPNSAWKPCDLASNSLNNAHGWRIDEDLGTVCEEKWRKVERRSEEFFGSRSQIQNSVMISNETVMI